MAISREEVIWAYRCILGREPESDSVIDAQVRAYGDFPSLRRDFMSAVATEQGGAPDRRRRNRDDRPTILIQNYHPAATSALIRDFKKIGMRVLCPDANWFFEWYAPNEGLGGELISCEDYMSLPSGGRILLACKQQEKDMKRLALQRGDRLILNVAQHHNYYEASISDILICPDIITFENYPEEITHKLLYFPRPHVGEITSSKSLEASFASKTLCSYINVPTMWPVGTATLDSFTKAYPFRVMRFGAGAPDGLLDRSECAEWMLKSFLTVHFKEAEAYGLSCLESMMMGTPIVGLNHYMADKTLGRFFLNRENSIVTDTVEEAVERVVSLSFSEYQAMSRACASTVEELTSDANTIDRLREAVFG